MTELAKLTDAPPSNRGLADVAVLTQGSNEELIETTLAALAMLADGCLGRVVLIGDGCDAAGAAVAATRHGLVVTHDPDGTGLDRLGVGTKRFLAVVRAGDVLGATAFASVRGERARRRGQRLYALVPTEQDGTNYRLTRRVRTRPTVSTERDATVMWPGSSGLFVRGDVLADCPSHDLNGVLGPSSLFLEAALVVGRYGTILNAVTRGTALEDTLTIEPCVFDPQWYFGLNDWFRILFDRAKAEYGGVPAYLQYVYLYLLGWRITYNRNTANKMVLVGDALAEFSEGIRRVLADVSDQVLFDMPVANTIDRRIRIYLCQLRTGSEPQYRYYRDDLALVLPEMPVLTTAATPLDVELMDCTDDVLRISGRYLFPIDEQTMHLVASYGDVEHQVTATQRMSDSTAFGHPVYRTYTFEVSIPLTPGTDSGVSFDLVADSGRTRVQLELRFRRHPSRLAPNPRSYWATGTYLVSYRDRRLQVVEQTPKRLARIEARYLLSLVASRQGEQIRAAAVRALYFLTASVLGKRRIWVYFDKLYKGGDNGEYAYRYAVQQRDGIKKYYILQNDVPDKARLRRAGVRTVRYNSLWQKLLYLQADIVFTTHITPTNFGGFQGSTERHFRGLFNYTLVCVQHGLSVQNLSDTLHQVYDNIAYFCIASPVERANLSAPAYAYPESSLIDTGLARFDGLVSDDKRRILISPTWRNYLAAPTTMGRSRQYSRAFSESVYCRLYNSVISHPALLATARECGYTITLLLHPVTSSQIDDFTGNDVVDVLASASEFDYERALTEASLMVTDYSGIQFDFAYMYKPVVYFHTPMLPASYLPGAYDYETMALGDICRDSDSLVDTVCDYMRNDCALKDEYRHRIEEFFTFHDRSSSERIYQLGQRIQRDQRDGDSTR